MNRKERRKIEKDLGLIKHKQKMNFSERIKSLSENIKTGKKREEDNLAERKRIENSSADQRAANEISSLATSIMVREGLSWHESLEAAKREIFKRSVKE